MKPWQELLIIGLVSGAIIGGIATFIDYNQKEYIRLEAERVVYVGRVTAIESFENYSNMYLNSNHQLVKIRGGKIDLIVGEHYRLTLDGIDRLKDAEILEEDK
jgi:hypothetical protein